MGRFEDLARFDCVVSAVNSFGLMHGGVDLAISQWNPQGRAQARIIEEYAREQPVGTSMIVATSHANTDSY